MTIAEDGLNEKQQKIADSICRQIAGGKSLRAICRDNKIDQSTIYHWLQIAPLFTEQYTRARDEQADTIFDQMLDIADDSTNDYMVSAEGPAYNAENVQRTKVRIDARKWVLGRMKPKKYGDKMDITSGNKPLEPFTGFIIKDLTKDDE